MKSAGISVSLQQPAGLKFNTWNSIGGKKGSIFQQLIYLNKESAIVNLFKCLWRKSFPYSMKITRLEL